MPEALPEGRKRLGTEQWVWKSSLRLEKASRSTRSRLAPLDGGFADEEKCGEALEAPKGAAGGALEDEWETKLREEIWEGFGEGAEMRGERGCEMPRAKFPVTKILWLPLEGLASSHQLSAFST